MTPTSIVIAIVAAPVVVLTFMRMNATLVFLSLCLGQILVMFAGDEAAKTVGVLASDGSTNQQVVSLGLLLVPAVFTALFTIRAVKGKARMAINVLPALSVGVIGLLLAEPLFSAGLRGAIEASEAWYWVQKTQVIVVVISTILSLFLLWLQRPAKAVEGKHHH